MRSSLVALLSDALSQCSLPIDAVDLDVPENSQFGDFSCNIAMKLSKKAGKPPRVLAQEIIDAIPANKIIEKTEIAGPGFINFFLKNDFVIDSFLQFSPEKPIANKNPKKICVEFSSPNVAKPLHFGHLRSTVIGDSLAKILEHSGNIVIRENFLGDWGTGFGKLVVAMEKWGDIDTIKQNPIAELGVLYQRFAVEAKENEELEDEAREAFRKLEIENDQSIRQKWEWIRAVSIEQVQKFYNFLNIPEFDWTFGESFYATLTDDVLQKIEKIGEISEGALVVKFLNDVGEEEMPLILFRRADGATLYQTRDVAHMLYCASQNIDEFITVVANEQSLHFQQVFTTAKRLGCLMRCEHVAFGMVLGADGKKFSTRKGNGVGLEEVFEEAKEKISGIISDRVSGFTEEEKTNLIEQIAVGAIKFNDLSQNRNTDIVFNWEKILSFEGFSGPFLQYSYARAKSILRKEEIHCRLQMTNEELLEELPLMKKMLEFSYIIQMAGDARRPNILAEYLFQLSKLFNGYYQNTPILKVESEDLKNARLFVVSAFAKTLKTGLLLLGISAPESM